MLTIVIFNLPWLVHCPEFNFPKLIFKDGETSKAGIWFKSQFQEELVDIFKTGVTLELQGYPDNQKIPKTNTSVNGIHLFKCDHVSRADLKGHFGHIGCKASNGTYLPHITLSKEQWIDPSFPITPAVWRSHEDLVQAFDLQESFREVQRVKLDKEIGEISRNKKLNDDEKIKEMYAAVNRLLTVQVCAFALSLKVPVLHFLPLVLGQSLVLCFLHFDCNEWNRVFERLLSMSCDVSIMEGCSKFRYNPGLGKAKNKAATWHPNLAKCTGATSIRKLYEVIKIKMQKTSLARVMVNRYTSRVSINIADPMNGQTDSASLAERQAEEEEQKQREIEAENENMEEELEMHREDAVDEFMISLDSIKAAKKWGSKCRLLGGDTVDMMRRLPELLQAVKPNSTDTAQCSPHLLHKYYITVVYAHLLKCFSILGNSWLLTIHIDELGCYFVADLILKICYLFSLPSSVNTCYMAKVFPFVLDKNKYRYRISPNQSLSMGLYGSGQGGEHSNKHAKKNLFSWTHLRFGFFVCWLQTAMYLMIAAKCLFSSFIPKKVSIELCDRSTCILKRFGPLMNTDSGKERKRDIHLDENSGQCTCCRGIFKPSEIKSFSVHIDELPDKTFGLQFMRSFLRYHMYEKVDVFGSRHSVHISELFSRFLFLDLQYEGCTDCAVMFQFIVVLYVGVQENISWVVHWVQNRNKNPVEGSDI